MPKDLSSKLCRQSLSGAYLDAPESPTKLWEAAANHLSLQKLKKLPLTRSIAYNSRKVILTRKLP